MSESEGPGCRDGDGKLGQAWFKAPFWTHLSR